MIQDTAATRPAVTQLIQLNFFGVTKQAEWYSRPPQWQTVTFLLAAGIANYFVSTLLMAKTFGNFHFALKYGRRQQFIMALSMLVRTTAGYTV